MEFRMIRQTSHINGENRNPGINEDGKVLFWDNPSGEIGYITIDGLNQNSYSDNGYVLSGNSATAGEYVWKLDSNKIPAWRKEDYLLSISRDGNDIVLNRNDRGELHLTLGSLAWEDSLVSGVSSVFGRSGAVLATSGDYSASQITNAFDKSINTLDDILEGVTYKHFTSTDRDKLDEVYAKMHDHSNLSVLDLMTDAGGGIIPSAAQISEWDTYSEQDAQNVMDTVALFIQNNTGISWAYDDGANTLTPTINLGDFTTDDLPEGTTNKYTSQNTYTFILPSASTVAGRCSGTIIREPGTEDWVLSVDTNPIDLLITHSLNRYVSNVTIFAVSTEGNRLLLNNAAYSGIIAPVADPMNTLRIESLATIELPIIINISFS